ncbi:hypothetical protein ERJ70_16050 [Sediminibacillus dalangtanensis]|uniref:Uncharacterized protein n=1 Tax=Sediminibacillus dalangtanensis TaxID=2729421 RepID=A0ABX7VUM4_9BACI|nr:hypothetical protein [Sediminibacillus dalangtanensis]QTN00668.1 hypothetical protein ERJ70_16050 [Sediminibacillus dalangtanensis]
MKNVYLFAVHVINLLMLGAIGFLGIAMFVDISAPDGTPTFNPIDIGFLIFLLLSWIVSYRYQIKHRKWMVILVSNLLYIVMVIVLLVTLMPLLYKIFYF